MATSEAGVQVSRRACAPTATSSGTTPGFAAVIVANHGDYRTGTGLNTAEFPDNEFPFEMHRAPGRTRAGWRSTSPTTSYGDFRQVHITGAVFVGRQSMLQVRGDDVLPSRTCSTITLRPADRS